MPTRRLADRQIRAAQQAVRGLDVRGPVSRALAKTGIAVPSNDAPETAPALAPVPRPPQRRRETARRVHKPFAPSPWPTRRAAATPSAPTPALSGLTADERRVHRILIDTLDIATEQDPNLFGGLGYVDRRKLEALDLTYIDGELKGKQGDDTLRTLGLVAAAGMLAVAVVVAALGMWAGATGLAVGAAALSANLLTRGAGATGQRRKILLALRELAVLAHDDALASDALAEADALIDRLADADQAPAPLLDTLDRLPDSDATAPRGRVRS